MKHPPAPPVPPHVIEAALLETCRALHADLQAIEVPGPLRQQWQTIILPSIHRTYVSAAAARLADAITAHLARK